MTLDLTTLPGVDKSARLALQRLQKQQEAQPPPLNPEFPYRVLPLDRNYFGAAPTHPKK